jgi:hypothetical protein
MHGLQSRNIKNMKKQGNMTPSKVHNFEMVEIPSKGFKSPVFKNA